MGDAPPTGRAEPADEARLRQLAAVLADAVERAIPGWVERSVEARCREWAGHVSPEVRAAAVAAGAAAAAEVGPRVRLLLLADVDEQRSTPLAELRAAVRFPTAVLAEAGMPSSPRDQFAVRAFPDDRYGLSPAGWADVDDSLLQPGLAWGAAKAFVFKARRRAEGRR